MEWESVKGSWNVLKGRVREAFGKLTDDDLDVVAGQRDQLVGRLQQRYGYAKEEAERRLDQVLKTWS
jgi:uncharacterized protein YjbJ (UPF0337 family)